MEQVQSNGETITLIHFVYEAVVPPGDDSPEGPPVAQWRIACMPNMTEFHQTQYHPNYQRTNEPRAVTCPSCKRTEMYKRLYRANG